MTNQQTGSTKKGRKTLTVYPHSRALQVLGTTTGSLNQSLECWANVVARASVDNATRFNRAEWSYLADCCNGTIWEPDFGDPSQLLADQVRDAEHFDGLGRRWLEKPSDVAALAEKFSGLSYAEAWGVILAIQFFWDNHEGIDLHKDEWWTLPYRTEVLRSHLQLPEW